MPVSPSRSSHRPPRKSTTQYFAGFTVSGGIKAEIRRRALGLMQQRNIADFGPSSLSRMTPGRRACLSDAIFEVENRIESRGGGQPDHPTVVALRKVRNRVLDDLGWNEADGDVAATPASTAA
jgi:hypothetical protein